MNNEQEWTTTHKVVAAGLLGGIIVVGTELRQAWQELTSLDGTCVGDSNNIADCFTGSPVHIDAALVKLPPGSGPESLTKAGDWISNGVEGVNGSLNSIEDGLSFVQPIINFLTRIGIDTPVEYATAAGVGLLVILGMIYALSRLKDERNQNGHW